MGDGAVRVRLTTQGRRTGRPHTVWLTAVSYMGDYYFSRHRPDSDWFLNALADPSVLVHVGGRAVEGVASRVDDPATVLMISSIKYPGQARAAERRVAIRVEWRPGSGPPA